MRSLIVSGLLFIMAVFSTAHAANPKLEMLRISNTSWYCRNYDDFVKWIEASNRYGPILLETSVIETFGCKATKIFLTSSRTLGIVKAFNVPVLTVEAQSNMGTVYTFVPILPSLPFKRGVGA